jgi:hypothetical protein
MIRGLGAAALDHHVNIIAQAHRQARRFGAQFGILHQLVPGQLIGLIEQSDLVRNSGHRYEFPIYDQDQAAGCTLAEFCAATVWMCSHL